MVTKSAKFGIVFALLSVLVYHKINVYLTLPPLTPHEEPWWGPGEPHEVDESVRPFKFHVSDEILNDLAYRLNHTIPLQKPLVGVKQHYGMNGDLLQTVLDFWKNEYNWREREKYINKFPHFLLNVQGLDVHFIHVKPKVSKDIKVLPIIIIHGWLGSIREMYEIIPLLTTPQKGRDFVFEVVVPSIPGYVYSEGASKKGFNGLHHATLMKNLMVKLGFQKFYVQGTDWGGMIVQYMSVLFPDRVIAMHSNFCQVLNPRGTLKFMLYSIYPSLFVEEEFVDLMYPLSEKWSFLIMETGYFHLQSTKPDTIGVGLRDSPAGLAAYILEKYTTLTNPAYKDREDGGLTEKYSMNTLIDNLMLYWVTRSITTSMRPYSEAGELSELDSYPIIIPTGCARSRYDSPFPFYPEIILRERFHQLIHLTYNVAGHFPALEIPDILANDIFSFVEKVLALKNEDNSK